MATSAAARSRPKPIAHSLSPKASMIPTVTISSRGEQRLRAGIRGSTAPISARCSAGAGDIVQVAQLRGRVLGPGAVQRSLADRDPDADLRRTAADDALIAATDRCGDRAFATHSAIDANRVPPRARRGRSPAVARRRSLRRLPRRADAVAGDGSPAAGRRPRRSENACTHAASSRATIRGRGCSMVSPQTRRRPGRRGSRVGDGARSRHRVRRRSAARPEDRAVSRSAREPRSRGAGMRAAACSTASATTAASR